MKRDAEKRISSEAEGCNRPTPASDHKLKDSAATAQVNF